RRNESSRKGNYHNRASCFGGNVCRRRRRDCPTRATITRRALEAGGGAEPANHHRSCEPRGSGGCAHLVAAIVAATEVHHAGMLRGSLPEFYSRFVRSTTR